MSNQICRKCGGEISNDFNHTLAFCTNCGASINLSPTNQKTLPLTEPETLLSPMPRNLNAKPGGKGLHYLFGCLGLLGAAAVLSVVGFFSYSWWSARNSADSKNNVNGVSPKSQTVRYLTYESDSLDPQAHARWQIANALFVATRRLLRLGISKFIEDENTIDGGDFDNTPTVAEAEQKRDVLAASIGFWFIIFGTLIWGYGDLLGGVAQYLSARQGI
jgi:hypothetical protein